MSAVVNHVVNITDRGTTLVAVSRPFDDRCKNGPPSLLRPMF